MLSRSARRACSGVTLVEMLVAVTLCGIVLALVSTIAFRQRRLYDGALARLALSAELRETAAILPIDLRAIATGAGDIRTGEARDTSLELRATIGSAVICDVNAERAVLAPTTTSNPTFAGLLTAPQVNDTAWVLVPIDTTESWVPHRITSLTIVPAGNCAPGAPSLTGVALEAPRLALTLDTLDAAVRPGVPLRLTRPERYSIYRASDGGWHLGLREWNSSAGRFNTVQPVAGAFLTPATGGLRMRYFDSSGTELPSGTAATQSIALITVALAAETKRAVEVWGSTSTTLRRRGDSVALAIRPRNRR